MISPEMSIHQAFFAEVHNTICSRAVKIASLILDLIELRYSMIHVAIFHWPCRFCPGQIIAATMRHVGPASLCTMPWPEYLEI